MCVCVIRVLIFVVEQQWSWPDWNRSRGTKRDAGGGTRWRDALLLVLANKQDLPKAMPVHELTDRLGLHALRGKDRWHTTLFDTWCVFQSNKPVSLSHTLSLSLSHTHTHSVLVASLTHLTLSFTLTLHLTLSLSPHTHSLSLSPTHTLHSLSLSLTHTLTHSLTHTTPPHTLSPHTHCLSLSHTLSLSPTHTHSVSLSHTPHLCLSHSHTTTHTPHKHTTPHTHTHSVSLTHTHSGSLSLSLTHSLTHSLSLSLSGLFSPRVRFKDQVYMKDWIGSRINSPNDKTLQRANYLKKTDLIRTECIYIYILSPALFMEYSSTSSYIITFYLNTCLVLLR